MHNRRNRKNFMAWIPVILAGILIIAAFVIAPSLLPSVSRGPSASSVSDTSRLPPSARVEERTPTTAAGSDDALPERRSLPPDGKLASPAGGARRGSQAGERRALPPDGTAAAPAGGGARKVPQDGQRRGPAPDGMAATPGDPWSIPRPGERRALPLDGMAAAPAGGGTRKVPQDGQRRGPAPDGMAATPGDEWSAPQQPGERRTPAPEGMAGVPADAGSRKLSQADERWGESPTETSTGATQQAPNAVNAAPEPQDDASDDLSVRWNQ